MYQWDFEREKKFQNACVYTRFEFFIINFYNNAKYVSLRSLAK